MSEPTPFVTRYRDIRPRGVQPALRHLALSGLAAVDGLLAGPPLPRVHVLNLHHVFPDEEEAFRRLLTWLSGAGYRFLPYGEAVDRVRSGEVEGPSVTFTFDDGLASGRRAGEILAEHGARGCFFLVTSMVGEEDRGRVARFCAERIHMPPTPFLGWSDVEALLDMGHEVGSHTHTHPVVAELDTGQVREELERSREELDRRLGGVRHFSWPYGGFRHFSPEASRAVFQVGFGSCASAERGAHPPGPPLDEDEVCLRRDHCVAAWPVSHMRWFMGRAGRRAGPGDRRWPRGWREGGEG